MGPDSVGPWALVDCICTCYATQIISEIALSAILPPLCCRTTAVGRCLSTVRHVFPVLVFQFRWAESSPIASLERTVSTLASHFAISCGTNVARANANRAIRIEAQRTHCLRRPISGCFGGRSDRQQTLLIRIAAITLAGNSAITIA